jgi:hypothetical protein
VLKITQNVVKIAQAIPIYKGIENTIRNASGIVSFRFVNHSSTISHLLLPRYEKNEDRNSNGSKITSVI